MNNKTRKIVLVVLAVFVTIALAMSACGNKTPLKTVYEKADVPVGMLDYIEHGDDWSFIIVDTNPDDEDDYYNKASIDLVRNLNQAMEFPSSVMERMIRTTYDQGIQTYEGKKFEASWTYHPNKGLCVTYEVADKK